MKSARGISLILVTVPNIRAGKQIAKKVLEARLAACVNILPTVQSHYWWQGKIEQNKESLLLLKTRRSQVEQLEALILRHHPYDTPEIISLELDKSTPKYLAWLIASTSASPS